MANSSTALSSSPALASTSAFTHPDLRSTRPSTWCVSSTSRSTSSLSSASLLSASTGSTSGSRTCHRSKTSGGTSGTLPNVLQAASVRSGNLSEWCPTSAAFSCARRRLPKCFLQHWRAAGFDRSPWKAVQSRVFGGNVTCAGLLLVEDYVIAVQDHVADGGPPPEQVVVPRVSFDVNDEDLSMRPIGDLARETASSVLLA